MSVASVSIGTLNEKPLHAALKQWYAKPKDRLEVPLEGYFIDIVRDDVLIEIQTGGFSAIRNKLRSLTRHYPVRLVYPLVSERWIITQTEEAGQKRRKSPKRGHLNDIFVELVSMPRLAICKNFVLEVLLIQEEQIRRPNRRRRRGWELVARQLVSVVERRAFTSPADYAALLPQDLDQPFSTAELAKSLRRPRWLAQKMAYCLREMAMINAVGKRGNAILYQRA